ncbi:MAG: EcsC family protein [Leptospiraceae bacterium]|nr:EcsC family protein [Leptospiraceae bacterium]MCK6379972.1 EcsC family protein [Leptospiraceae bacterium]NUM40067.1 EcsC family protein [Leptospiraceae bacterium]
MKNEYSLGDSISKYLITLFSGIDNYNSPYAKTVNDPSEIVDSLIQSASLKSAAISASLSLPPGPFGWISVLPELLIIFRIQGHLIKDIAALYGKEVKVNRELLLYCMFKHGSAHIFRRMVEETSARIIIRPTTIQFFEKIIKLIGMQISKKMLKGNLLRWVPLIGATLTGGFAYLDTRTVGKTTKELFAKEILTIPLEISETTKND